MRAHKLLLKEQLCSCIGVIAQYAHILLHRNKPDRFTTTPNLLTKSNPAS